MITILGAGLSGLSIGYLLKKKGIEDFIIIEKENEVGGLCRSFNYRGHTYDIGGHILFSKDKDLLNELIGVLGDNKKRFYRNNAVWYKGLFVKYPFENGMSILPAEERYEILITYLKNDFNRKPTNFGEWMYYTFGKGLTDKYLMPYNRKIWKRDPYKMDMTWVERIPRPPMEDMVKSALGMDTEGYTHQLYFYYPIKGGIQSLTDSLYEYVKDHVILSSPVKRIYKDNKWIVETNKDRYKSDIVVSTIPVLILLYIVDMDDEIKSVIDKLEYNSIKIAFVALKRNPDDKHFAVYVPDNNVIFHRMCFTHYIGQSPENEYGVMMEITYDGKKRLDKSDDEVLDECINGLEYMGLIDKEDVIGGEVQTIPYAYVVYDYEYPEKMKILNRLNRDNFYLAGRFGSFRYLNMDAVFKDAKRVFEKIEKIIEKY